MSDTPTLTSRDHFLSPVPSKTIEVTTRIGVMKMQELSGSQFSKWIDWVRPNGKEDTERKNYRMERLVTLSIVDDNGEPILQEDDVTVIAGYPSGMRMKLINAAAVLNGLGDQEEEMDLRGKSSS